MNGPFTVSSSHQARQVEAHSKGSEPQNLTLAKKNPLASTHRGVFTGFWWATEGAYVQVKVKCI